MPSSSQTIRRRLLAAMLLAPFVPVLLAFGAGGYLVWSHAREATLDNLAVSAEHQAYVLDRYLDERFGDLLLAGGMLGRNEDIPLRAVLDALQGKHKAYVDVALVEADGDVRDYAGPTLLKGVHVTPGRWLAEALERGESVMADQPGQLGVPHAILARRLTIGDKPVVLRVTLDSEAFSQVLSSSRQEGCDAFLINRKGENVGGHGGQGLSVERELVEPYFLDRIGSAFFDPRTGTGYASRIMRHGGWVVAVRAPQESAFRDDGSSVLLLGLFLLSGGIIVFLSSLYLTGYVDRVLRIRDDEREKLREQLYRAGRLAELGEMAAGFAHEINNPLQIMKSDQAYIEMLLQDFKDKCHIDGSCADDVEEMVTSLTQIRIQIDRCARITHSILSFGRVGSVEVQNIDLGKFIPDVLTMVRKKMELNSISMDFGISPSRLVVHVDPGRLQQVLLNLLNNAMHAISEVAEHRAGAIALKCMAEGSDRVRIAISDNGAGISPENQKLIFTPFFTTKPAGSGTGLGLSVCHGIVDSMNGVLDFTSVKGQGSTFFILLPRVATA